MLRKAAWRAYARLADVVICRACGSTGATMAERCTAALDVRCEGFERWDAERSRALARLREDRGGAG